MLSAFFRRLLSLIVAVAVVARPFTAAAAQAHVAPEPFFKHPDHADFKLSPSSVVYEQDGAFVAQCLDVDVASEGDTEEDAVANLTEALELHFDAEAPVMTPSRAVRFGEIVIHA